MRIWSCHVIEVEGDKDEVGTMVKEVVEEPEEMDEHNENRSVKGEVEKR